MAAEKPGMARASEASDRDKVVPGDEGEGEMSEAEIDQNLADTFPASDPPSWTLGTDHREDTAVGSASEESPNNNPGER